ncbi:hypothetical protein [Nocardioides sp. W7]|uniref:hypothetical protein n=1 Tax=Nocardioides sp. W7 TaxID=2931390 RepID=UPI001FD055F1|nr:hypothetical protein [Nocardioides sp. W7]
MTDAPPDPQPTLDIDWLKTLAGALAAVTTAVLLSTLGAAGTLIGAAFGSVAATVGTALYSQGLASSRQKVAKVAKENALLKVGVAQSEVRRAARRHGDTAAVDAHLEHADEQLGEARQELDAASSRGSWRTALPWRRVALLAAGTFVVAMLVLLAFEAVGGKPVSSYTGGTDGSGGTSISRLGGSSGSDDRSDDSGRDSDRDRDRDRKQQDDRDESEAPSPSPTDEPTEAPSETPTPLQQPSDEPTQAPTEAPTETPGGATAPSPTAPAPSPAG